MKRVNVYAAIREMREQIVKTMQERGIKELVMVMPKEEWAKENNCTLEDLEEDDSDYIDYQDQESPYVVFFDKWQNGTDYRVEKVTLKEREGSGPILEFECWANELGYDTFGENDVVFLTLYNVYTTMYDLLEIKDEPEKVWVVKQESNVDGEYLFNVIVCKDAGTAIRTMKQEIDTLLDESPKYKDARRWIEGTDETLDYDECPYSWENESYDRFFINVVNDDYHELLTIEEMEIKND